MKPQETVTIRLTYKYRLYRDDKRQKALHQMVNVAGMIWNHALALQRRYYRLFGGYVGKARMQNHLANLRMRTTRYAYWRDLGSQAVQEIAERLDNAYLRFFGTQGGFPRFKKVKRYKSFTLKKTSGWKVLVYNQNKLKPNGKYTRSRGVVAIGGVAYKFVQHRPMFGVIKTVTMKRDAAGRFWVCFSVLQEIVLPTRADLSRIGGFDFGLRTFLTDHTGKAWMQPQFFREVLHRVQSLNRSLSRKVDGSHNRERTRWLLARAHIRVADKRRDFHFKLANALCKEYDVLVFETLNIAAMKRLWGRKVSDLAFSKFLAILQHVALHQNKRIITLDRFEPTTQTCSGCGERQAMSLKQQWYDCPHCGLSRSRDHNAAINIRRAGASAQRAEG